MQIYANLFAQKVYFAIEINYFLYFWGILITNYQSPTTNQLSYISCQMAVRYFTSSSALGVMSSILPK